MATIGSTNPLQAGSAGASASSGLASDGRGLDALRRSANADPRTAAREAAKQFESLFTAELLKSMRAASQPSDLDNEGSRLGTQLLDAQLSAQLAGRPGGLADVLAKQLERQMALTPGPIPSTGQANTSQPTVVTPANQPRVPTTSAAGFIQQHASAAKAAEAATGIPSAFMLAQAGHETGWGRKEIIGNDGSASHNLFGIKATPAWKGPTVDVTTTEYDKAGTAQKVVQKFRAYGSEAESFADYAKLMKNSPRYAGVVAAGGDAQAFAQNLQKAGYATDPAYADKLTKAIGMAVRLQRGAA
jgi:flagellar protein FlgJ